MIRFIALIAVAPIALAGCHAQGSGESAGAPGDPNDPKPFAAIDDAETVHFVGTEPFWGGEAAGGSLLYTTPEDAAGNRIQVDRFAGRNGLSFSGRLADQDFVLAVTPGECSDGMSDRSFPYVATLMVRGEQRSGCAWTDSQPYEDPRG